MIPLVCAVEVQSREKIMSGLDISLILPFYVRAIIPYTEKR